MRRAGSAGHGLGSVWLTTTVGPTAYVLLITSGIARPGPPLYGMLEGLAATILVAFAFAFTELTKAVANRPPRR